MRATLRPILKCAWATQASPHPSALLPLSWVGFYETRREAESSRRGGGRVVWSGDACVALAGRGRLAGAGRGRRKRPHSTPHPLPPLRVRRRFRSAMIKYLPTSAPLPPLRV